MRSIEDITSYKVPIICDEGECISSEDFGLFHYEPFLPYSLTEETTKILLEMDQWMETLHQIEGIDWCGVYLAIPAQEENELDHPALLKLAYRGAMSRALFPITEEFAKGSNNSTVALSGKTIVVNSVESYVDNGGAYYTCDQRVCSEYCAPFFGENGRVIGIIDVESFTESTFANDAILQEIEKAMEAIQSLLRRFVEAQQLG